MRGVDFPFVAPFLPCALTVDMSGGRRQGKPAGGRPLDGAVGDWRLNDLKFITRRIAECGQYAAPGLPFRRPAELNAC